MRRADWSRAIAICRSVGCSRARGAIANPFTFVGQLRRSSDGSGLYDMRDRSYDPMTGQFVSNDPLGIAGLDTNLRRYVGNSPTNDIDPSGLLEFQVHGDVNAIGFQESLTGQLESNGNYSSSLDTSVYLGLPGFDAGAAINWGGKADVTASIGLWHLVSLDLQYGNSSFGLVGAGFSVGTPGPPLSFSYSPLVSAKLVSGKLGNPQQKVLLKIEVHENHYLTPRLTPSRSPRRRRSNV